MSLRILEIHKGRIESSHTKNVNLTKLARGILNVQEKLCVKNQDEASMSRNGFLMAPNSLAEIKFFLKSQDYRFYVALEGASRVVGYLKIQSQESFKKIYLSTKGNASNFSFDTDMPPSQNSLYICQIAVMTSFHKMNLGKKLLDYFQARFPNETTFACVLRKPFNNARSHGFFKKMGFIDSGSVSSKKFMNLTDVVSTVFIRGPKATA